MKTIRFLSAFLLPVICAIAALAGCVPPSTQQLGERPAQAPLDAAEAYLRRYQPGPEPRVFQTTRILDRHGLLLAERWDEGRRTWVTLDRIARPLLDATIATEDATFYTNVGIDPARVVGAALQNAQEGEVVSGSSTITMQLARNLFFSAERRTQQTMDRKLLEAGLAQELTTKFNKDEILEMYFNLLNYGYLTYGPEAASQVYFGKPAAQLNLAEATLLAGIPQQPANFDLFRHFDAAKSRQRVVLDLMVRHGFLTQIQADAAFGATIALNPNPDPPVNRAPHFVQYVEDVLDERLGSTTKRSGLVVTTTLNLKMQILAQDIVARKVQELKPKHDLSNGALVAMRPDSGEVLAMVGSADFSNTSISGQVNVARSQRQPGSAIKPILYATALSDNLISPATVLWDVPVKYPVSTGQVYRPANYDGKFHGPVTVRTALANSYNIPAVKLLDAVGLDRMLASSQALGLRSLSRGKDWYGLSLTLGGGEVTLLELTTAYTALASGGHAVAPEPVLAATDALGRTVDRARAVLPAADTPGVISPAAAFQVTDILSDNTARTPMFGANSPLKLSRPAAAKTGTTDDYRDNWTIGYTRYLVAGAWAGNSDGRPMTKVSGVAGAGPIWHDFMEGVLADPALLAALDAPAADDAAAWAFVPPADIETRADCPPDLACRAGGEFFSKSWLAATGEMGPLADSVVQAPTAPVYVQLPDIGRWTAYCRVEPAAVRTVLKLPGRLGVALNGERSAAVGANPEALQAIAWSLRHPTAVDLGQCDALPEVAAQALAADPQPGDATLQVWADLSAALDLAAGPAAPAADISLPVQSIAPGDYRFSPQGGVSHHDQCPGHYIVGQVLNRDGAPLPGVHIVLVDEWGNRADAWSKSGAADFGRYDFPINTFANRYTLTVLDEGGNPISASVTIEHLQGAGGASPCHTLVWIGG